MGVKKLISLALAAVMVVGLGLAAWQYFGYNRAAESQAYAQELAFPQTHTVLEESAPPLAPAPEVTTPLPEDAAFLLGLDVQALQRINGDVLGWISIPGTDISYPLMGADSRDEYLYHDWQGNYNPNGSIYLESRNSRDLTDFNTILYGHHMNDGSMFGGLIPYRDMEYRQANPCVYIATADQILQYQIFSAWEAPVDSDAYRLVFRDDAKKQEALSTYTERSVWDSGITPTAADRVLTLSTCTGFGHYATRWVVQAVLAEQWTR